MENDMREAAAIIAPAIDINQITRDILHDYTELQDCDRRISVIDNKASSLREERARRRVDIGRKLIAAKATIRHGGWLPYIEKLGISSQDASEWMRIAGFVELPNSGHAANVRNLDAPSRRDAGIDKRPRKSEARNDEQPDPEPVRSTRTVNNPELDIDRELLGIHQKIMTHAKTWPAPARLALAHELRSMAELIEEMNDE